MGDTKHNISGEHISIEPSEVASGIADSLISAYAEALKDKNVNAFELMQSLAEFLVSTVKTIEKMDVPPHFRGILMRNIELNFDYRDAADKGIDISKLLIMGVKRDVEGDLGDI